MCKAPHDAIINCSSSKQARLRPTEEEEEEEEEKREKLTVATISAMAKHRNELVLKECIHHGHFIRRI
jgi:hypothetical protein